VNRDDFLRRVFLLAALFNVVGGLAFAFPASLGWLIGLPSPVPTVYAALVTFFVVLFAGTYAWVAVQPRIHRPLVALAAIGKAGAFVVFLVCWLFGAASGLSVVALGGDLAFAAIFAWWLLGQPAAREGIDRS